MWPWEHAGVGYVLYSFGLRILGYRPPSERETLVLLLATQLPDLVDKPLSWQFHVFPSGYALGHSALVAVPVGVLVLGLAARRDRLRSGVAFTVGYWSHLLGDVLIGLRLGTGPAITRVLWPLFIDEPYAHDYGISRGLLYIGEFLVQLQSVDATTLVVHYLFFPLVALVVWLFDGAPGLAIVGRLRAGLRHR